MGVGRLEWGFSDGVGFCTTQKKLDLFLSVLESHRRFLRQGAKEALFTR